MLMGKWQKLLYSNSSSKSGKRFKPKAIPSVLRNVGLVYLKWSQNFRLGTQSAIFGHVKMGTFGKNDTLGARMKILRPR